MGYKLYFDGVTADGVLDSTVTIGTTDSVSCGFRSIDGSSSGEHALFSSADGSDAFLTNWSGSYHYNIRINGINYSGGGVDSDDLYDGLDHTIEFNRYSGGVKVVVDGVEVLDATTPTTNMEIDYIASHGSAGDKVDCELSDIVIGPHTYPLDEPGTTTIEDTSGGGNNITLTDVAWVKISAWEWIGDFLEIDKTYTTQAGLVTEERKEGTRRRNVVGYSMDNPINKQSGEKSEVGITAYNGDQLSTLTQTANAADNIACENEIFTPLTGTEIFIQAQTWVSWFVSFPT